MTTDTFTEQSIEYVRRYYGVPAKIGGRVVADGKPGVIVGAKNQYLLIDLDVNADREGDHAGIWHPTWHMSYVSDDGTVSCFDSDEGKLTDA